MKVLFLVLFLFSLVSYADEYTTKPLSESAKIEQDILEGKLADRTQKALGNIIMTAAGELRKKGHSQEASQLESEWFDRYQFDFKVFASGMSSWDIGDHKPLSKWLADKYEMLEIILGVEVCKRTHLSDLKTFNFAIPVVFRPCTFSMDAITDPRIDEYRNHFSYGSIYYGLVPVVTYWVVYGVVTASTMGTGFVFIAGAAGALAEKAIALVTPKLSDKVYTKFCGGEYASMAHNVN